MPRPGASPDGGGGGGAGTSGSVLALARTLSGTATSLTPRIFPMPQKLMPPTVCIASAMSFIAAGLPRAGVLVKFIPQDLHR